MRARILLTNDDGIHAAGFEILERLARTLSDDVWVCAPETEQSGASHSLTIHRPLRLRKYDDRRFSVDGTPTDCMLLAIGHLMRHHKPDLVLSGVNQGLNIAEDVTYSGTVAAAMEATLLGVRAIALSQDMGEDTNWCWQTSERWAPEVIRRVLSVNWPRNVLLNVNFPPGPQDAVKGIAVVGHGNARVGGELTEGRDPRGRTYFWIGGAYSTRDITPDTDREALREGKIAITPLYMDMTHYPMIETLQRTFR